jgi:hypothetical protein
VVAKVEFHFGELFPRVGFIVTNLSLPSRPIVGHSVGEIDYAAASGGCQTAKTSRRNTAGLVGPALVGNSLSSRVGEAYDARVRRAKSEIPAKAERWGQGPSERPKLQ